MAPRSLAAAALAAIVGIVTLALARPAAGAAAESAAGAGATAANGGAGTTVLERYLTGLKTLSTEFTQTVTDAHGVQTEAGSGSLQLQRPDKFRWDYRPASTAGAATAGSGTTASGAPPSGAAGGGEAESGQLMVADGKSLWFYDRELAQVTVKPIGGALSSTPIMLLSSTPEQLQESFQIMAGSARDGLQWVDVKPRNQEADFSHAELGFEGERLARMIVHDNLGQTVRLDFARSERNVPVAAALLQFKPPPGVDVIGTAH